MKISEAKNSIQSYKNDTVLVYRIRIALAAFIMTFIVGVVGIMYIEEKSFVDSVYFSVVTMATVGYGDVVPRTVWGKCFAALFIILSLLAMYAITTMVFSLLVAGQLKNVFGRRRMEKDIAKMHDHIIVCGCGRVGVTVIDSLVKSNASFVVIDSSEEVYERLSAKNIPVILGDATTDEALETARTKQAKGIIAVLSSDALNVYVTLAAKDLNPKIRIVARAERTSAENKLIKAGAETVIAPSVAGAISIATAMLEPIAYEWFSTLLDTADLSVNIVQTKIAKGSRLIGVKVIEGQFRLKYDVAILAIKRGEQLISTPACIEEIMQEEDTLIMVGALEQLEKVKRLSQNKM